MSADKMPDQPDGIDEQSRDLPDPKRAAERIREYICASGDGLYDVQGGNPLYARDLEAVVRASAKLPDVQEELSRTIHTLDLARRELGATREEADRFGAELATERREHAKSWSGAPWDNDEYRAQRRLDPATRRAVIAPVPGSSRRAQEPELRVCRGEDHGDEDGERIRYCCSDEYEIQPDGAAVHRDDVARYVPQERHIHAMHVDAGESQAADVARNGGTR